MKSIARGLLSSQISQLNQDDPLASATVLCDHENWPSKTAEAIFRDLIIPAFNKTLPELSIMDVSVIGAECLLHIKPYMLKETSEDVCRAVCEKIGSSPRIFTLSPQRRIMWKDACLLCLGKIEESTNITTDDLDILGRGMVQEMTSELSRIDPSSFQARVAMFRRGCFTEESLKLLRPILASIFGQPVELDPVELQWMGDLIRAYVVNGSLDDANANKTVIADASYELMRDLAPTEDSKRIYMENCMHSLSVQERIKLESLRKSIFASIINAYDSDLGENYNRRKRDGSSWVCVDISAMGPSIMAVSTEMLQSIRSDVFYACLSQMSQYSEWDVDKRDLLLQKVKDDIGEICSLSTEDLVNLGYFSLSLSGDDISCLPMKEDDLVAALGYLNGWTSSQLSALAGRYKQERSVTAARLTDVDVSTLGHIICGFSTTELQQLTTDAFVGSSAQLGEMQSCPTFHLSALRSVAIKAFGPVEEWGAEIFSELGIIVAGLSIGEINSLTADQIEGIQPRVISVIPSYLIVSFTVEQFATFSIEQALAITRNQWSSLTVEQDEVLTRLLDVEPGSWRDFVATGEWEPYDSIGTRCEGHHTAMAFLTVLLIWCILSCCSFISL